MDNITKILQAISQPYRITGNEVKFEICPYCKGGDRKDKNTFSINKETGQFCCKRGKCGVKGGMRKLNQDYNVQPDYVQRIQKNFRKPQEKVLSPQEKVYEYFEKRGISKATVELARVKSNKHNSVVYDYYDESGELTFRKVRQTGEKNIRREKGTKPVFYMMDHIRNFEQLIITEGEEDCLSLWESGIEAVSLPSGASDMTVIDNCWNFLEQFETVIIWTDKDVAGRKAREELSMRVGLYRCKYIIHEKHKDANDVLIFAGKNEIINSVAGAKYFDISDVIDGGSIDIMESEEQSEKVESCFKYLNIALEGGYRRSSVIIWTGYTSSGKTTVLSQEMANLLEKGESVCIYNSESSNKDFMRVLYKQISGEENLESFYFAKYDKHYYNLKKKNIKAISQWFTGKIFIISDSYDKEYPELFKVFDATMRRYGVKTFIIDNMATLLPYNQEKLNGLQTEFIKKSQHFAKSCKVTVHIVAHQKDPHQSAQRKIDKIDSPKPSLYGVMGTSNLSNLVDIMIGVARDYEEDMGIIKVLKDRYTGNVGDYQYLEFNRNDKKFREQEEIKFTEWKKYLVQEENLIPFDGQF